jgi:hypothetical protein
MDALQHSYGAEPMHHQLLFNFPMNHCCPVVSPLSNRCLDSTPPAAAWLTVSPPHHRLPTPIKRAPISTSPHCAHHSPPLLSSPAHLKHPLVEELQPPPRSTVARPSKPLRRLVPTGVEIPVPSSCFPRHRGEVPRTGTRASRAPVSFGHCSSTWSTMDCELKTSQWSTGPCTRSTIFLF